MLQCSKTLSSPGWSGLIAAFVDGVIIMNAYTSQEELALLPANRISYARSYSPAASSRFNPLAQIKAFFTRQAAMREMSDLTDRELVDIGLTRGELAHVFDAGFAARRSR